MSLMRRFFGTASDPLEQRAAALVEAARLNASGMWEPLRESYAFLDHVNIEDWDFFLAVAGVFIAVTRLTSSGISTDRESQLLDVVVRDLEAWDPNALRAHEDCRGFFDEEYDRLEQAGHEPRFTASDALGAWIVWNLLKHAPGTHEEVKLVRDVGALITHAFFDWWDEV